MYTMCGCSGCDANVGMVSPQGWHHNERMHSVPETWRYTDGQAVAAT
jgi:hypothetical protein